MKIVPLAFALSLAALSFALPSADAIECVAGNDAHKCLVSVQVIYCVTEPCDGVVVCVDHGLVCSNRLPTLP